MQIRWFFPFILLSVLACNLSQPEPTRTPRVVTATPNAAALVQPTATLQSVATAAPTNTPAPIVEIVTTVNNGDYTCTAGETPQNLLVRATLAGDRDLQAYTVQSGDTLLDISYRFDIDVSEILSLNNIPDARSIFAGQKLILFPEPDIQAPPTLDDLPDLITEFDLNPAPFYEGEIGCVAFATTEPVNMTATFMDKAVPVISFAGGTQHILRVAIPLQTATTVFPATFIATAADGQQTTFTLDLQVVGGNYNREIITLAASQVNLLDFSAEEEELQQISDITTPFTPERYNSLPLQPPSDRGMSSLYGVRRSYNGDSFNRLHNGVDFLNPSGTPIRAAAAGKVVFAGTLPIRGNTVIIDHGWGLYTLYAHQEEVFVVEGDEVISLQMVGTAGTTGRSIGSHLHWEAWMNGVSVNPLQWLLEDPPTGQ